MRSSRHIIIKLGPDEFRLRWTVDLSFKSKEGEWCPTSRERHKDTDLEGARRFAKKWRIQMPWAETKPFQPSPKALAALDRAIGILEEET